MFTSSSPSPVLVRTRRAKSTREGPGAVERLEQDFVRHTLQTQFDRWATTDRSIIDQFAHQELEFIDAFRFDRFARPLSMRDR
jgi:hypothetical protein